MKNESLDNEKSGHGPSPKRQWTPAQRARQAKRIREYKPWLKSTGPKTLEGKQKVRQNAYKHGAYDADTKAIRRYLAGTRLILRIVNEKIKEMRSQNLVKKPGEQNRVPGKNLRQTLAS